jgi:hypothetical protein
MEFDANLLKVYRTLFCEDVILPFESNEQLLKATIAAIESYKKPTFWPGGGTTYSLGDDGKWWKRDKPKRCQEEIFFHHQCEGIDGHDGPHWRYNSHGSLEQEDNEYDPKFGGGHITTPPDHKDYIPPVDMMNKSYGYSPSDWVEVTDPAEIARLNADELGDNESASRPVTDPVQIERLKKIKEENALAEIEFNKGKPRPNV